MASKRSLFPVDLDSLVSSSSASSPSNGPQEEEVTVRAKIVKTVTFKAKPSETMKNIKSLIKQKENTVPAHFQELVLGGNQVNDRSKLRDYIAAGNSTIKFICRDSYININVERITVDGTESTGLQVKMSDTVEMVKSMMDSQEGTKSYEYELFFSGTQLQDDMSIGSYGVQNGSILYMMLSPIDTVSLRIALPCGRVEKVIVKPLHTIFDLKVVLQRNIEAPIHQWHLAYSDEVLEDTETIAYCRLEEDSLLHVILPSMQIFVRLNSEEQIPVFIKPTDDVLSLKRQLFDKKGYAVQLQKLIFQGTVLVDSEKIVSYGIKRSSIVHLRLKFPASAQGHCNGLTTVRRV